MVSADKQRFMFYFFVFLLVLRDKIMSYKVNLIIMYP